MKQKRHSVDQIVSKLRKADVELGKGKKVPEVCKELEVTEQTYYRWRRIVPQAFLVSQKRYPIPRTVSMSGAPDSSFLRSERM